MWRLYYTIATEYLLNRKRQTITSIFAVSMGVAVYIIISALVNGNELAFIEQAVNTSPHIIMNDDFEDVEDIQPSSILFSGGVNEVHGTVPRSRIKGIENYEGVINAINNEYSDLVASPILKKTALLRHGKIEVSSVNLGIVPESYNLIANLSSNLKEGTLEVLSQEQYGIILGADLAKKLKVKLGDYLNAISSSGKNMRTQVVGILQTGIVAVDYNNSYLLLNKAQSLHNEEDVANEIHIKIGNIDDASKVAQNLQKEFGYPTKSWIEMAANIFSIFKIQRVIIFVVVFTVLLMASVAIYTIISTIVYEKYRDIAIFKSMGFYDKDLRIIFILQGVIISIIGILLGWVFAFVSIQLLGLIKVEIVGFVKMDHLVLYHSIYQYLSGAILAFVVSILGTLISIRKAIQVNPVEIVRVSI